MHWDIDTQDLTANTFDGDTGVSLECYPMDFDEGVSWRALDPDADEFTVEYEPKYLPGVFETLWSAIEDAETWYARWLAADDREEEDGEA